MGGEVEAAEGSSVDLLFEAAVGGGIPLIRPLRESLAGERVHRVMGIVNGTTNYVLTRMTEVGADYHGALVEAQQSGFAERDPTADVRGLRRRRRRRRILATIRRSGAEVVAGDVYREGISDIKPSDIAFATRLGYVVKLLAIVERIGEMVEGQEPDLAVGVHPTDDPGGTPPRHRCADSYNASVPRGRHGR
ncbi:MAG: hypothetical protein U5R31_03960 [Acidimicrobiia bacterium]|nr:hypothetical protein [Acidimicrobiia bacterium]